MYKRISMDFKFYICIDGRVFIPLLSLSSQRCFLSVTIMRSSWRNSHSKGTSADWHRSQESGSNSFPEASCTLSSPSLPKTIPHTSILLIGPKAITLHFALHNIERITSQPQCLTRQPSISSDFPLRDLIALDFVSFGICIHHVLEREKPHAIGLCLPEDGYCLSTIQTSQDALVCRELPYAVNWAGVETIGAMRLCLEANTDMFDRA